MKYSEGKYYLNQRIINSLSEGLCSPFILLCSPAGYGKTTALKLALDSLGRNAFWINLEKVHNNPNLFLEELDRQFNGDYRIPSSIKNNENIDNRFLDLLSSQTGEYYCVLDNYHVIENNSIHETIQRLIAAKIPGLHLVISSRLDPPFALSKIHLQGELFEMRTAHLTFSQEEATGLVEFRSGKAVPTEESIEIWHLSEGWPALICILVKYLDEGFSSSIYSNHMQAVYSYFEEEIFSFQSPEFQEFLVRTSILEQLTPTICEAVTELINAKDLFRTAARAQLMLPDKNGAFRFHKIFSEFLRQKLADQKPQLVVPLHQRAAAWFEQHGVSDKALRHTLESGNITSAVEMINLLGWDAIRKGQQAVVLQWIRHLENMISGPISALNEIKVFALLQQGEVEEAESILAEISTIRGVLASAMIARIHGQYEVVERVASDVLSNGSAEDLQLRCQIELQLGLARLIDRKVLQAEIMLSQALYHAEQIGNTNLILATTIALSAVFHNRGDYSHAISMLERVLALNNTDLSPDGISSQFRLGQLLLEIGQIEKAKAAVENGLEKGASIVSPEFLAYGHIVQARISRIEGDFTKAAEHHQAAARLAPKGGLMRKANLAERMKLYLVSSEITVVESWAAEQGLIPENAEYTGDEAYLVLAQLKLQTNQAEIAVQVLSKLVQNAQDNDWVNASLLILPWLAIAQMKAGKSSLAEETFIEALQISAQHGYCLAFIELFNKYPLLVQTLLSLAAERGVETEHVTKHTTSKASSESEKTNPIVLKTVAPSSKCFEVRLFGGLRVFRDGMEIAENGWRTESARDLLALLAINYNRPIPIDLLIDNLWPQRADSKIRRLFHTNLYYLRRTLLHDGENQELFIHCSGNYSINREFFWIDLQHFDDLVAGQPDIACLTNALQVATAPCLLGFYKDWAIEIQQQYDQQIFQAHIKLAHLHARNGDLHEAIGSAEKALEKDPLDENLARQLMGWYYALGNRAAAIMCYESLRQNLAKELSIEPSLETLNLAAEISKK